MIIGFIFNDHLSVNARSHYVLVQMYGFNPLNAERELLDRTQLARSLASCRVQPDPKLAAERAARLHKLLSNCARQAHITAAG